MQITIFTQIQAVRILLLATLIRVGQGQRFSLQVLITGACGTARECSA